MVLKTRNDTGWGGRKNIIADKRGGEKEKSCLLALFAKGVRATDYRVKERKRESE